MVKSLVPPADRANVYRAHVWVASPKDLLTYVYFFDSIRMPGPPKQKKY